MPTNTPTARWRTSASNTARHPPRCATACGAGAGRGGGRRSRARDRRRWRRRLSADALLQPAPGAGRVKKSRRPFAPTRPRQGGRAPADAAAIGAAPAKRGGARAAGDRGDHRAAGGRAASPARDGTGRPRAVVADAHLARAQRAAGPAPGAAAPPTTTRSPEDIDEFRNELARRISALMEARRRDDGEAKPEET